MGLRADGFKKKIRKLPVTMWAIILEKLSNTVLFFTITGHGSGYKKYGERLEK